MNTMKLPCLLVALCAGLAAQTAQTAPVAPRHLADVLPASTYAVAQFGGLAACAADGHALPMAALLQRFLARLPEDVRAERLDRGIGFAADRTQRTLARFDLDAADLRALLGRPMALAVGRLTIEGMGPSLALVIDERGAEPVIGRWLAALRRVVPQRLRGATLEAVDIDGLALEQIVLPGGPPILFGSVGGCLLVSNSRGYLREVAAVVRGQAPSLGAAMRATAPASAVDAPLATLFVDGRSLLASLEPHLPYESTAWTDALGLGAVHTLHASLRGGADVLHVGVAGSSRGLVKVLFAAPADLSFARACSPNTVAFGAGSLDVAGLVAAWHQLVELLPPQARGELQRELRRAGVAAGEIEARARAFAPQVACAFALEKGAVPKPELLVHVGVRDATAVAALLQQLEAVTGDRGVEWRTRMVGEQSIRFCNVRLPDGGPQLSPCYVLRADGLWLASDTAALVRALRQSEAADGGLAAQPDFVALARSANGASGLLHLRLFRAAELGWRSVETWLYPQVDEHRDELGFGREALPDADETARALGTSTLLYRIDDAGITVDSRGPFTVGSLLAALGAVADEVLARAGGRIF